jgi:hypothetical protein
MHKIKTLERKIEKSNVSFLKCVRLVRLWGVFFLMTCFVVNAGRKVQKNWDWGNPLYIQRRNKIKIHCVPFLLCYFVSLSRKLMGLRDDVCSLCCYVSNKDGFMDT